MAEPPKRTKRCSRPTLVAYVVFGPIAFFILVALTSNWIVNLLLRLKGH